MAELTPKEKELVAYFEAVNGRKPSPVELKALLDSQVQPKTPKKSYKKLIILSLVALFGIVAFIIFGQNQKSQSKEETIRASKVSSKSSSSEKESSKTSRNSSTSTQQSSSISSSSSTTSASEVYREKQLDIWNASRQSGLASFMQKWGNEMNQPDYKRSQFDSSRIYWMSNDQPLSADYQVLDCYEYWYGGNSVHRYFFTISPDGSPLVLYSPTTNGDKFYVKETENDAIKAGFRNLMAN